jgi:MFS transporter, YNFM family, putative membrane transport protein
MKNRILVSASLFHALTDAATTVVPMVFPLLYSRGTLITSYSQIGLLSNLGLLATLLVQFLIVRLSCHIEYKTLMLASFIGISVSLACVTLATSFFTLLAFFLFMRVVTGFYHPLMISWVSKSQPASGLDHAMGIQSGSGNIGVLMAFLSVGYLAQKWDWKMPLVTWALFGLVLGTLGTLALRGVSSKSELRPSLHIHSWMKVLVRLRGLIPGFIFGGMGWSVTIYYAPSLLNHQFSVPIGRTGLYLSLWIGLGTVSGYSYGYLSRRFGRRAVFLASIGVAALSLAVIGLAPGRTVAVAGLLVFGVFLLMTYPSLHTFVGSSVAPVDQTQAFSWVSNIQLVAGALISLVAGVLSDRFGIRAPFVLSSLLAASCFVFYALPAGSRALQARSQS